MAGLVPMTIVLALGAGALGAGALGGPDALRLLLAVAGQSLLVDMVTCVLVVGAVTAPVLGTMLLARFFRKARKAATGGAPRAAATDHFTKMTLMMSMVVAFLVTACLLVALFVEPGAAEELHLLLAFAGSSPLVAVAGAALVLGTMPLARFISKARSAAGAGAAPVAPARECSPKMLVSLTGAFLLACCLLFIPFLAGQGVLPQDGATLACSA